MVLSISTLLASTMIKGSPLVGGPFVINARGVELRVIPERFRRPAAGASGDIRAHEVPLAALQLPSPPP